MSAVNCYYTKFGTSLGAGLGAYFGLVGLKVLKSTNMYFKTYALSGRDLVDGYLRCYANASEEFQRDCSEGVYNVHVHKPLFWGDDICVQTFICSVWHYDPIAFSAAIIGGAAVGAIIGGTLGAICDISRLIFAKNNRD